MTRDEALRILGLASMANPNDIKKAYRNLVKITHPDRNSSPGAQQRFIQVQTAYEILTDPYQQSRHEQEQARRERAAREWAEWDRQEQEEGERVAREARARAVRARQEREAREKAEQERQERAAREERERQQRVAQAREEERQEKKNCGCLIIFGIIIITAIFGRNLDSCKERSPIDSTDADVYVRRGEADVKLGRYSDAIKDYDEAIRLDPKYGIHYYTYYRRGYAKNGLEKYTDAI